MKGGKVYCPTGELYFAGRYGETAIDKEGSHINSIRALKSTRMGRCTKRGSFSGADYIMAGSFAIPGNSSLSVKSMTSTEQLPESKGKAITVPPIQLRAHSMLKMERFCIMGNLRFAKRVAYGILRLSFRKVLVR